MNRIKKKQLIIYLIVAYGITYLLGLLMWYGNKKGLDVSAFPNAQMFYPAAGVALGYLVTRSDDRKMPKWFFRFFVLLTGILILIAVLSVIFPDELIVVSGNAVSMWTFLVQSVILIGSFICWILLIAAGKERRKAYGLNGADWKRSFLCILLFFGLYVLRTAVSCAWAGQTELFGEILNTPMTWIMLVSLIANFFLTMSAFFGEEYGWRYYLQPILQERFGLREGVLILGIIWGLWHLPVDFFYYSPGYGLQAAVAQQITCITLGIFFAYAYMKTKNIWVPVILHFMNNNLIAVFSGNYSASVLEGQVISWGDLVPSLVLNGLIFGNFIFAGVFKNTDHK